MKKEIETKNYVILLIIIVVTFLAVFYARSWYLTGLEYREASSVMTGVLNQINEDEISNCLSENPNAIIYASSMQDSSVRKFETAFKKMVNKYNLSSQLLYVNLDSSSDSFKETLKSFAKNNNIASKVSSSSTSIYIFEDGKLSIVISDVDKLGIDHTTKLLKKYGVIDNE